MEFGRRGGRGKRGGGGGRGGVVTASPRSDDDLIMEREAIKMRWIKERKRRRRRRRRSERKRERGKQ